MESSASAAMDPKNHFVGGGRRGYHHGRLKDALVEAARTLIAERGPTGFTLAEAAKLVGVTAAAPYRHFPDRNALMGELARRGFSLFGERLRRAWGSGAPTARTGLQRMGEAYIGFARDEPGLYGAMFNNVGALASPDSGAAADRALDLIHHAAVMVLRENGAAEAGAGKLAFEIWALAHGVALLALGGHLDPANPGCDPIAILLGGSTGLVDAAVRQGLAAK
jgi:AcrR family transcriptional regulator